MTDYLEMDKIPTGSYHETLLDCLHDELKQKRLRLASKKVLLDQDNTLAYTSAVITAKPHEIGFEIDFYPPYSPYLTFFVSEPQKLDWRKQFSLDEEVVCAANKYYTVQNSFFFEGTEAMLRNKSPFFQNVVYLVFLEKLYNPYIYIHRKYLMGASLLRSYACNKKRNREGQGVKHQIIHGVCRL